MGAELTGFEAIANLSGKMGQTIELSEGLSSYIATKLWARQKLLQKISAYVKQGVTFRQLLRHVYTFTQIQNGAFWPV